MCGVTGYLSTAMPDDADAVVARMASAIARRGPDDSGHWIDREAGMAIGHRRLSIVDLSPAGHQPMVSTGGRFVLAFNGEIYNHQEIRSACDGVSPRTWRGHSDTESLLAAFEMWGVPNTLSRIVGMFAIALWDRESRTLTLCRDRAGEKPMYYGWQGNSFLFGSELAALKAHPAFRAEIDRRSLTLLMRHNYIPAPYSIYQGIFKLPAGSWLQVSHTSREGTPTAYWSLAEVAQGGAANPFAGTEAEALEALERKLTAAVRGQMMSDVPLGALLSGGIDSTTITALMQSVSPTPVRTFTIGFEEQEYDETVHARAVARHLATEHTELRLTGSDAQALIPALPDIYDEPFADSSQLPTHLVMKLARQKVTVALSGDGGDEFFGGYNRYMHAPKVWKKLAWLPYGVRRAVGSAFLAIPAAGIDLTLGRVARLAGVAHVGEKVHKLGHRLAHVKTLDEFCVSLLSEWPQPQDIVLHGAIPSNLLDEPQRWPKLGDAVDRMMALDAMVYLPDDILVKVDRAAMAVSLETRAPFLDRDIMEFAWSLPRHMKIRDGQGKWIVRKLLDKHVPRALIERPKMGFAIPIDAWLRGPLRSWGEDLLDPALLERQSYFDVKGVRRIWDAHQRGYGAFGHRLWSVLMFQSWLARNA